MKWERIASRFREHAHRLRQALAGALELRRAGTWGRQEIEAAGLRDYERIFGHAISPRTFWRLYDRAMERDAGANDFSRLELYLPTVVAATPRPDAIEKAAKDFPDLSAAILGVKSAEKPSTDEAALVWDAAFGEWWRLRECGASDTKASKAVVRVLESGGILLAANGEALRKMFRRKLARWIAGGYTPEAVLDQRPRKSGHRRALPLSDTDRKILTARALQGSLARAWRDTTADGELSGAVLSTYIANPASKSYVPQRIRELVTPDVEMLQDIHHGPRQAALRGAYISRDWSSVSPGSWYSADDTTLPLYYWEEGERGTPRVLRGQFLVMIDCGTSRVLSFALHSERNYTARVIRGLILQTHDSYGLPREGFFFERGTWAKAKLLKGSSDEVPAEETELGLREWVRFRHAKPGNARAKTVERVIGLLQERMENQPGYCGRNEQTEKFERLQKLMRDAAAGHIHPSKFLLHRDEWAQRLEALCDAYNNEPQQGTILRGISPRQAWEERFDSANPLIRLSADTRFLLLNHRRPVKVTRNGVCVQVGKERHWFRNEMTGALIGRTVQVYFNPEDLSSVFLKLSPADKTASVVPAAAPIPAMDASREHIQAAHASVSSQNAHARTLYQEIRTHFPDNGPSHFRRVIADAETIELGQEIAADQAAIRGERAAQERDSRQLAKFARRFGTRKTQSAVSPEAQRVGYKLLEEAANDAD